MRRNEPNRCELVTAPPTRRRRHSSITLPSSYGMWRAVALLAFLGVTQATVFTESGSVHHGLRDTQYELSQEKFQKAYDEELKVMLRKLHEAEELQRQQENSEDYMSNILEELTKKNPQPQQEQPQPQKQQEEEPQYPEFYKELGMFQDDEKPEEKAKVVEKAPAQGKVPDERAAKELEEELRKAEEELDMELAKEAKKELKKAQEEAEKPAPPPQVPQKKGQSEFVSFVEPVEALKQTKSIGSLDKRRLSTSAEHGTNMPGYTSNSLLLIAVGTVMAVGLVGTVVGGGYYLKRRTETPDDGEYAPYAGTGPGFKKNKGNKGDETLAYKAQLHQYQQAKQKIICGEDAPGVIESENEDDGNDEENNFSVYECPGLAPTGDIEVCNPNFAAHP
ncbi:unnamed protein product [Caenorhabditis auriculariae]|uniref:Uncharacterized protein n=1 Tax=Caenorhabditis auriculariae TaxID=2777116 RepID=A0A8S1GWR0_9PELO|nr:unnamed protein product [Caenorhabditis auriculariae]